MRSITAEREARRRRICSSRRRWSRGGWRGIAETKGGCSWGGCWRSSSSSSCAKAATKATGGRRRSRRCSCVGAAKSEGRSGRGAGHRGTSVIITPGGTLLLGIALIFQPSIIGGCSRRGSAERDCGRWCRRRRRWRTEAADGRSRRSRRLASECEEWLGRLVFLGLFGGSCWRGCGRAKAKRRLGGFVLLLFRGRGGWCGWRWSAGSAAERKSRGRCRGCSRAESAESRCWLCFLGGITAGGICGIVLLRDIFRGGRSGSRSGGTEGESTCCGGRWLEAASFG